MTDRDQVGSGGAFIVWLETVVAARSISWRRLAEAAGVSPSALSALRTGRAGRPSMETCHKLAAGLGLDADYVLGLAGHRVGQAACVNIADPELDLMFHGLMDLTPEEREPVKEFVRYALARAGAKRARPAPPA